MSPELTTVTKLVRRVGWFDPHLAAAAIRRNAPAFVVLTFWDYVKALVDSPPNPEDWLADQLNTTDYTFAGYGYGPHTGDFAFADSVLNLL